MKKTIVLLETLVVLFSLVFSVRAQSRINYSLLVGEWGDSGKCSQRRTILTKGGRYISLENKDGQWKTLYSGIYLPLNNNEVSALQRESPRVLGAIIVAEGFNMGGDLVEIHSLNRNQYSGKWRSSEDLSFENPADAFFNFVKCPSR